MPSTAIPAANTGGFDPVGTARLNKLHGKKRGDVSSRPHLRNGDDSVLRQPTVTTHAPVRR
jgi:hypothetical protein